MQKGTCRFFNGSWHNKTCKAGVNYRELVGGDDMGWVTRLPCHEDSEAKCGDKATCDKRQEPTDDEVAESEIEIKKHIDRFLLTLPLIAAMKKKYRKKDAQEVVECPVCKGNLHLSISGYNGHVWGKCETENCLAWME